VFEKFLAPCLSFANHFAASHRGGPRVFLKAFCAGQYAIDGSNNLPCMVYADFHKQLWLFYDVRLPFLATPDLLSLANSDEEMVALFEKLNAVTDQVNISRN